MLADASLHGDSLVVTLGIADASLRRLAQRHLAAG
jgi:hypothetical protein